ncbi:hypothetical protein [Paraburkholderia franconis]|nr:hypothetical protein [Paraburkholderia franconis]
MGDIDVEQAVITNKAAAQMPARALAQTVLLPWPRRRAVRYVMGSGDNAS